MSKGRGPRDAERCTFCEKDRRKVLSLIAGPPGTYICNECVELCNTLLLEEMKPRATEQERAAEVANPFEKPPTPQEIKDYLDEYVVGQDHAKRVLAVSVYHHYQRILHPEAGEDDVEIEKSNVLLIGPTGSGKTLMARTLARFLKVPFAISDATTLTEAGYVGEDVENIILRLVQAANYNVELAERGIIYVDEIDKIARTTQNVSITRDVSGEGVQQGLLKILEGTTANIPPQGGRKHPEQHYLSVNTGNILFIVGGTFVGLEEIIGRRIGSKGIGYHSDLMESTPDGKRREMLHDVESSDLVQFGLIPEFVGRLPVAGILNELTVDDFIRIMQEPRNALIRQYQKLFSLERSKLDFTQEALVEIAKRAKDRSTGVRALRSILEEAMLDVVFELPDRPPSHYTVTPEFLAGKEPLRSEPLNLPPVETKSAAPEPDRSGDSPEHREAG